MGRAADIAGLTLAQRVELRCCKHDFGHCSCASAGPWIVSAIYMPDEDGRQRIECRNERTQNTVSTWRTLVRPDPTERL